MTKEIIIQVQNFETYDLNLRNLLKQLIEIYANEMDCSSFAYNLSKSYSPDLYSAIFQKLIDENIIIDPTILLKFKKVVENTNKFQAEQQSEEVLLLEVLIGTICRCSRSI